MKQALHIFKKDVRYLRYDIALTLFANAVFCFVATHRLQGPGPVTFILPVAWWFLIARVIHAEAPSGNRQFWLTRPYEWKSLLSAKVLFVFAFVNLPLLIADAAIIHAVGFSIAPELPGLLWTQVLLVAAYVLPVAALSAITSGLSELLIVTLLFVVGTLAFLFLIPIPHWHSYWMELEWVKTYFSLVQIAIAGAIVLISQYALRRTFAARIAAGAAALIILAGSALFPWTTAFALQTHMPRADVDISSIRIGLDTTREWMARVYAAGRGPVIAELPLHIGGLPAGTRLKPNGLTVMLRASDGEAWVVKRPAPESFDFEAGITLLQAEMPRAFYAKVKHRFLKLRGTLYFTVYGNEQSTPIPLNRTAVRVRGVGFCSAGTRYLLCKSAFRTQSDWVMFRISQDIPSGANTAIENLSRIGSYSPLPAGLNIDPVNRFFFPRLTAISEVSVETWQPLAHLERNFAIDGIHLDALSGTSEPAVRN